MGRVLELNIQNPQVIFLSIFRAVSFINSDARFAKIGKLLSVSEFTENAASITRSGYIARNALLCGVDYGVSKVADVVVGASEYAGGVANIDPRFWAEVSNDIGCFDTDNHFRALSRRSVWSGGMPEAIQTYWNLLKAHLLEAAEEDWRVWTDWYEARLRGDPIDESLEYAKAMIPDDIWEAGPKSANAEIRRLMREYAPTPEQLEAGVSPQPVLKNNKADVQPNDPVDRPEITDDLLKLPERQRAVIRVLIQSLRTNKNFDLVVIASLEEYDGQLRKNGSRPELGTLDQMHQAVRDEYLQLNREKFFEAQRGLRRQFLSFFANHKQIKAHFPLDAERETHYLATEVDTERLQRDEIQSASDALDTAVQNALDAEAVTHDYLESVKRLTQDIRRVVEMPPPAHPLRTNFDAESWREPPEIPWWKRAVIRARSFAGASLSVVASVATLLGFTETKIAKALWNALKAFRESLFELVED